MAMDAEGTDEAPGALAVRGALAAEAPRGPATAPDVVAMPGGLGTLLGPTDAMPSPPEKNTIDAALARSLMPTAPIPV
jgi:hypothetical protein